MPYKDPEVRKRKQAEYAKRHYQKNKTAIIARVGRRRKTQSAQFAAYKATLACTNCGENHPATLDFHHVERHPTNKKVHKLVQDGHWWKRIMEEIAKCVVLCSNCHRIHHHDERVLNATKKVAKAAKSSKIHTSNTPRKK
jgi:hypothetical protein